MLTFGNRNLARYFVRHNPEYKLVDLGPKVAERWGAKVIRGLGEAPKNKPQMKSKK